MTKVYWGLLKEMRSGVSKSGTPYTACILLANKKWMSDLRTYDVETLRVYYYDTQYANDATRCLDRQFLCGQTVALVASDADSPLCKIGVELPTSHGFVKMPAEIKPADAATLQNFRGRWDAAVRYNKILPECEPDLTKAYSLVELYQALVGSQEPLLQELKSAIVPLFWGEKWAYIGPIGNIGPIKGGVTRVSVCPYHTAGSPATWSDISFWDPVANDRVIRSGIGKGDIVFFDGMFLRKEYQGRKQFSGQSFNLIKKAEAAAE